ncbi:MAG TPA: hypothetical protein VI542_30950 [Candidatus Tectomicrobia bacterium]
MDHLAAYWNAMAVRRNQKTDCWWVVPEEEQTREQEETGAHSAPLSNGIHAPSTHTENEA